MLSFLPAVASVLKVSKVSKFCCSSLVSDALLRVDPVLVTRWCWRLWLLVVEALLLLSLTLLLREYRWFASRPLQKEIKQTNKKNKE